jgi:hypothetical protein
MAERKAGELLDALNVTLDLEDSDMVTDVVVLAKNVCSDGEVSLVIGKSETTSWLEQLGLVYAAADILRSSGFEQRRD